MGGGEAVAAGMEQGDVEMNHPESQAKRERMAVYLDWLLTPEGERTPSTKTALAELLGVSMSTLRNYTNDPWLQRQLVERTRAVARVERLPEILQALYVQATDPDNPRSVAAARTYLEFLRQTETVRETVDLSEMDQDDLIVYLQALLARQEN